MMHKYGRKLVEYLEYALGEMVVVINGKLWPARLTDVFKGKRTVGVDYTAYDKSIPGSVVYRIVMRFYIKAGAPEKVARWIAAQVAFAPLVLPDGRIVERFGGNPSGNMLTTILNSFWSLYGWHKSLKELGVPNWRDLLIRIAGDDAVVEVGPVLRDEFIHTVWTGMKAHANQETKPEFMDGNQPFPGDFMAPFLGRIALDVDGFCVTIPLQPGRNFPRIQQKSPGVSLQAYADSIDRELSLVAEAARYLVGSAGSLEVDGTIGDRGNGGPASRNVLQLPATSLRVGSKAAIESTRGVVEW